MIAASASQRRREAQERQHPGQQPARGGRGAGQRSEGGGQPGPFGGGLRLAADGVERDRALPAGERAAPTALLVALCVGLGGSSEQQRDERERVGALVRRAGVLASVVAGERAG